MDTTKTNRNTDTNSIFTTNIPESKIDSLIYELKNQSEGINKLSIIIENSNKETRFWNIVTNDTLFTVTVTIAIFFFGILLDRIIKWVDKRIDKKKLRLYFKSFLDNITEKVCPILAEGYKHTFENVNMDTGIPTGPPKVSTGNFERIKNIQDKELFYAVKEKSVLAKIYSNLDYLENLINEIDIYHKNIRAASDKIREPLQDLINDYFGILAKYIEHIKVNNPSYPNIEEFSKLVNELLVKYHEEFSGTRNLKRTYTEIIRPIQEKVIKTNIFRNDVLGMEIAKLGREISLKYFYLQGVTDEFKKDYITFYKDVLNTQTELIEDRKKIKWNFT